MSDTSAHNTPAPKISGFHMFLAKVNTYKERYDMVFERKWYATDTNPFDPPFTDYVFGEVNRYKIYDKYIYSKTKTPLRKDLTAKEAAHIVKQMNDDELLYLRQIYEYCYGPVSKKEWLNRFDVVKILKMSQNTAATLF